MNILDADRDRLLRAVRALLEQKGVVSTPRSGTDRGH